MRAIIIVNLVIALMLETVTTLAITTAFMFLRRDFGEYFYAPKNKPIYKKIIFEIKTIVLNLIPLYNLAQLVFILTHWERVIELSYLHCLPYVRKD